MSLPSLIRVRRQTEQRSEQGMIWEEVIAAKDGRREGLEGGREGVVLKHSQTWRTAPIMPYSLRHAYQHASFHTHMKPASHEQIGRAHV